MRKKLKVFVVFSCLVLTMCRSYAPGGSFSTVEGLTCQAYTAYFQDGLGTTRGVECYYECPDGTVGPLYFDADPGHSATKGDLDRMFCGIEPEITPTSSSPSTASTSPIPELSPTAEASPTPVASPVAQASATGVVPLTGPDALLTGGVTMCDTGGNLISFRINQPPPDLSGKKLTAQIGEQESSCYVNATNPSLMTCTLPPDVTFPAEVVVSVDGTVAGEFIYDGLGCARITTPVATTTP